MKRKPRLEFYLNRKGEWAFRLVGANGQIQAQGEGYKTRAGVLRGIAAFRRSVDQAAAPRPAEA